VPENTENFSSFFPSAKETARPTVARSTTEYFIQQFKQI